MNVERYKEFKLTVGKHSRVIQVKLSRYGGWIRLRIGEFPLIEEVSLGSVQHLPIVYYLLEGLAQSPWTVTGITLPCETRVKMENVKDKTRPGSSAVNLYVFRSAGRGWFDFREGDIKLMEEDMRSLLNALLELWEINKEYILGFYPYKAHPELAKPPVGEVQNAS